MHQWHTGRIAYLSMTTLCVLLMSALGQQPPLPSLSISNNGQTQVGFMSALDIQLYANYLAQPNCSSVPTDENPLGTCKEVFLDFTGQWDVDYPGVVELGIVIERCNQTFKRVAVTNDRNGEANGTLREFWWTEQTGGSPPSLSQPKCELLGYSYDDNVCESVFTSISMNGDSGTPIRSYHCWISPVLNSLISDANVAESTVIHEYNWVSTTEPNMSVLTLMLGFHPIQPLGNSFTLGNKTSAGGPFIKLSDSSNATYQAFGSISSNKYHYGSAEIKTFTLRNAEAVPAVRMTLGLLMPIDDGPSVAKGPDGGKYIIIEPPADLVKLYSLPLIFGLAGLFLAATVIRCIVRRIRKSKKDGDGNGRTQRQGVAEYELESIDDSNAIAYGGKDGNASTTYLMTTLERLDSTGKPIHDKPSRWRVARYRIASFFSRVVRCGGKSLTIYDAHGGKEEVEEEGIGTRSSNPNQPPQKRRTQQHPQSSYPHTSLEPQPVVVTTYE